MNIVEKTTPLDFNLHTLILTVGPSGCGKSHFCKNVLVPGLKNRLLAVGSDNINVQYISSDDMRREVLGQADLHKHHPKMTHASQSAFELLHAKVHYAMQWPTNAQFIVVDTTGLSEDFRQKLISQAADNNYQTAAVVFDYKDRSEYDRYNEDDPNFSKSVLHKHLKRMRTDFFPAMKSEKYGKIHRVKSKNFDQYRVEVNNLDYYMGCFLNPEKKYDIISDIHGCYGEFAQLLQQKGYVIDNGNVSHRDPDRKIILVGDLIDKGPRSKDVLSLVYHNPQTFKVVLGNHENFVHKFHKGVIKSDPPQEVIDEYFTCVAEFKDDAEALQMLEELVTVYSRPFFVHPAFIVTHAPCKNKFLGKLDRQSIKQQCKGPSLTNVRDLDRSQKIEQYEQNLHFVKDESIHNAPFHVFGHVSLSRPKRVKNKIFLDSGCVHGGELACVDFVGGKPNFAYVKAMADYGKNEDLISIFDHKKQDFDFNINDMDPKEKARMNWVAREKVNFISGTMAPASSDVETNQIEPIEKAYEYYQNKGIETVVLQPKYMGSRCNLYLHKDISKCYATSRNGYTIKRLDLTPVFEKMHRRFYKENPLDVDFVDMIVVDGELMPWHALGEGLIEDQFNVVKCGVESELALLMENGFEEELANIVNSQKYKDFLSDVNEMTKKDIGDKYGQHMASTFRALMGYKHVPLAEHQAALDQYTKQLEIFGSPGELDFKPFCLLKVVDQFGDEFCLQDVDLNSQIFSFISQDDFCIVHLSVQESRENGKKFFESLTKNQKMEGVVVKPDRVYEKGVAPFLKVRSEDYLHIIYGYDYRFPEKYRRLVQTKKTSRKIATSISEFEIGLKMLETPIDEINECNVEYLKLIANMISEEKRESTLDPRL